VTVPHTTEVLGPLLTVIPMQQLAFHIGVLRCNNVDKPRHLEKVVSDHNLCGVSLP
jgi:glucosamine--fructose-6-phosphate aminotransferase (isomerizing)